MDFISIKNYLPLLNKRGNFQIRASKWITRLLTLSLIFLTSNTVIAAVPGGVQEIPLSISTRETCPRAFYDDKRVLIIAKNNEWTAIIGIPLQATPGQHQLKVKHKQMLYTINFEVSAKKYPSEEIQIQNQRQVTPLAEDLEVIAAQQAETIKTYQNWLNHAIDHIKLAQPVAGRFSSPFGYTRIINGIPKSPHSGLDIAAPKGTPVIAAKDGIVSNTGSYFFSGNMVFIDHGQSFITSYAHLDQIKVTTGQSVKAGEIIGTVGNTGRATGPHLHWSVSLNGVRVNPELFIDG